MAMEEEVGERQRRRYVKDGIELRMLIKSFVEYWGTAFLSIFTIQQLIFKWQNLIKILARYI